MNPPDPSRSNPPSANNESQPPLGRPLEDHVEAMARALYAMQADQLRQAQQSLDQLSRLAGHYLDLQQGSSASLSCAHLCQNGQGSLAGSRTQGAPLAANPTENGASLRQPRLNRPP